ncbi:MAG: chromate transporter [Firmicutes bacterium HGW-Firmicutes-1]|jgi:chromate transporter|nr:MAG: chromate transporter [Firmicutes bacterium HGW-Firmicutes-1]
MIQALLELFMEFFSLGIFSYGGGLAILVLLQEKSVELGWLTLEQFADVVAISQSTPGPIAINLATFVGYFQGSILGSLVATIAVILPGFVISIIVAKFMDRFNEKPIVKATLKGLRAIVIGLIATAILNIAYVTIIDLKAYKVTRYIGDLVELKSLIVFGLLVFLSIKFKKHPIYYILPAGVVGLFLWQ